MSMDNPTWVTGNLDTSGLVDLSTVAPHLFAPAPPEVEIVDPVEEIVEVGADGAVESVDPADPDAAAEPKDEVEVKDEPVAPGAEVKDEVVEPAPVIEPVAVEQFDPADHTIPEIITYVEQASAEEKARVIEAEIAGRNRKTLLAALAPKD